ncbi:hypothetical protein ABWH96_14360 [Marivirga tractuosa]|uniref:hypothetical protein n=1 Tax=Marivirga tractuosa TaxID=1006 RepID=UPI0035CFA5D0
MKKKVFYFGLSLLSLIAVSSADYSKSYAQTGGTCYQWDGYFCRLCNGNLFNHKQVTLCSTSSDPVKELEG